MKGRNVRAGSQFLSDGTAVPSLKMFPLPEGSKPLIKGNEDVTRGARQDCLPSWESECGGDFSQWTISSPSKQQVRAMTRKQKRGIKFIQSDREKGINWYDDTNIRKENFSPPHRAMIGRGVICHGKMKRKWTRLIEQKWTLWKCWRQVDTPSDWN